MSETTLVLVLTAAIIVAMFAWVPLLHLVCPPCGRSLNRVLRRRRETVPENGAETHAETA